VWRFDVGADWYAQSKPQLKTRRWNIFLTLQDECASPWRQKAYRNACCRETKVFLDKPRDVIRRHTVIIEIISPLKTRSLNLQRQGTIALISVLIEIENQTVQAEADVRKVEADVEVRKAEIKCKSQGWPRLSSRWWSFWKASKLGRKITLHTIVPRFFWECYTRQSQHATHRRSIQPWWICPHRLDGSV
jgi:hypothetical protein